MRTNEPAAGPPLALGQAAPDFCLMGDDEREHRLTDYRGKTVILYFYPKDATPGCTTEACDFRDQHGSLAGRGAVVIGVSPDSVASHKKFKDRQGLPFLLLSDPGAKLAAAYGAYGEKVLYGKKSLGIIRSTFVIGPDGRILQAYPKVQVKGHVQAVLQALAG